MNLAYVPDVRVPPAPPLPSPNARDDFLAAAALLPKDARLRVSELHRSPTEQLRAVVRDGQPALARLRVGLGYVYARPRMAPLESPPELRSYQTLSRLLRAEAEIALREGKADRAVRDALDLLHFGSAIQRGGDIVEGLSGNETQAIGLRVLEIALPNTSLRSEIDVLQALVELDAKATPFAQCLIVERNDTLPLITRLARESPVASMQDRGETLPLPLRLSLGLLDAVTVPRRRIVEEYQAYTKALAEWSERPAFARGPAPPEPRAMLVKMLVPVFFPAVHFDVHQARRRILTARFAVRAYQAREGRPPPSLAALVPKYLPAVPQDPFAPAPLVYRITGGTPVLYSRGPDGDDDGGRDLGSRIQPTSDGDLAGTLRPVTR